MKKIIAVILLCSCAAVHAENYNLACAVSAYIFEKLATKTEDKKAFKNQADYFVNLYREQGGTKKSVDIEMKKLRPAITSMNKDQLVEIATLCNEVVLKKSGDYNQPNKKNTLVQQSTDRIDMSTEELADTMDLAKQYFFAAKEAADRHDKNNACLYSSKGLQLAHKFDVIAVPAGSLNNFSNVIESIRVVEELFNSTCK
jgi:hypothetical protein